MKMLDCFCGMGGVSDGFALEGFDVTGIDIVDAPKMLGYKHKFIQADMATLKGEDFRGYDVIWGSPPCRDFSVLTRLGKRWKQPPDENKGLILPSAFLAFIYWAKSTYWIMENVPRLEARLGIPPEQIFNLTPTMERAFWGNYPHVKVQMEFRERIKHLKGGKRRPWLRARIPLACSRAFAKACRGALA
jgi:DNA (cytosine-5)-methyltransferase 1